MFSDRCLGLEAFIVRKAHLKAPKASIFLPSVCARYDDYHDFSHDEHSDDEHDINDVYYVHEHEHKHNNHNNRP